MRPVQGFSAAGLFCDDDGTRGQKNPQGVPEGRAQSKAEFYREAGFFAVHGASR
jgi:hypothetical protein